MNRIQLQNLASEWVRVAKNDIRNKIISIIEETNSSERELAYALAISDGELKQILEGNGEISLSTFAKLLIATGNALEIKPIEDTPIRNYENLPSEEELECPLQNMFARPKPQSMQPQFGRPNFSRPTPTMHEEGVYEDEKDFMPPMSQMPEALRRAMEDRYGRPVHRPERFTPKREVSPFESKSRDELVNIIQNRLWATELDINHASKEELVAFLDEKNRQMAERKRMRELEEDPKINEFKKRLKTTFDNNPHLRDWAKKIIEGIA